MLYNWFDIKSTNSLKCILVKMRLNRQKREQKLLFDVIYAIFELQLVVYYCSDPLEGGGTIYSNGFFLFREFSPLDIFIVES